MQYEATAKHIHISTRKLRLLADSVRRLTPSAALAQLVHMPKSAAGALAKVMASAVANAKQKNAQEEQLRIKIIEVMGAGGMKRWHAVSRGQAHAYKKRMTHVRVVLSDDVPENKQAVTKEGNK
jgi:large subunit ribosomal protein L22